jgi:carbon storage regulator
MLILQRKAGESLVIGGDTTVTVVSVEGGRVRLAISAPKDTPILRSELVVATAANRDAAQEESAPSELLRMLDAVLEKEPAAEEPKKGET